VKDEILALEKLDEKLNQNSTYRPQQKLVVRLTIGRTSPFDRSTIRLL